MKPGTPQAELFARLGELFTGEALFDSLADVVYFIKNARGEYVVVNQTLVKRCGFAHKKALIGKTPDESISLFRWERATALRMKRFSSPANRSLIGSNCTSIPPARQAGVLPTRSRCEVVTATSSGWSAFPGICMRQATRARTSLRWPKSLNISIQLSPLMARNHTRRPGQRCNRGQRSRSAADPLRTGGGHDTWRCQSHAAGPERGCRREGRQVAAAQRATFLGVAFPGVQPPLEPQPDPRHPGRTVEAAF